MASIADSHLYTLQTDGTGLELSGGIGAKTRAVDIRVGDGHDTVKNVSLALDSVGGSIRMLA
jgi:hypothetical protein